MSKNKKQGAIGLWFELDKETNHLLKLQAERNGRSKRAEALAIVKQNIQQKTNNNR